MTRAASQPATLSSTCDKVRNTSHLCPLLHVAAATEARLLIGIHRDMLSNRRSISTMIFQWSRILWICGRPDMLRCRVGFYWVLYYFHFHCTLPPTVCNAISACRREYLHNRDGPGRIRCFCSLSAGVPKMRTI